MSEHKPLEIGETYYRIDIVGHNPIFVFINKDYKKDSKDPILIRDGVKVYKLVKLPPKMNDKVNEYELL